jgi:hypothetical protein
MSSSGGAFLHDLFYLACRLFVKIAVPQKGYAESIQGSLEMWMIRVQQRSRLSATANRLDPEEICHSNLRRTGALLLN